jgi:hypothetical protein
VVSVADLIIRVVGKDEASGALRDVNQAAGGLSKTLGDVTKIAGGVLLAQAPGKIISGFGAAIEASSNLEESINAVNQVFGENAGEIHSWAKENANAIGLSVAAYNAGAVPMAAMLKNAGLEMGVVTDSTIALQERAADMASVFNTDVATAIDAINAGLRGEGNPLEKYGVSLSAAAVEAEALAATGKKSAKELTNQEKALARINLIMAQTSDVQGDFKNTSDGAANSARIAAARQEELAAAIGSKLMPVQLAITRAKLAFLDALNRALPAIGAFIEKAIELGRVVGDVVLPPIQAIVRFFQENESAMQAAGVAIGAVLVVAFGALAVSAGAAAISVIAATFPLLAIVAVIAGVSAGIFLLIKHWDDIVAKFPALGTAADGVKVALQAMGDWITGTLVPNVQAAFENIKGAIQTVMEWITGTLVPAVETAFGAITTAIGAVITFVSEHWGTIQAVIEPVFAAIQVFAENTFKQIETIIDTAIGVISGLFQIAKGIFTGDWGLIKDGVIGVVGSLRDGVIGTFENMFDLIKDLVPIAAGAALDLASAIGRGLEAGVKLGINAFIGLIEGGINVALSGIASGVGALKGILDAIPGPNPLGNTLQNAIDNLNRGISIPRLAKGGIVTRPTLALIGEAGPEAVVPLGRGRQGMGHTFNVQMTFNGPTNSRDMEQALDAYFDRAFTTGRMAYGLGRA